MLAAALAYVAHGWAVFPLRPGMKVPLTRNGLHDASTDPEQVAAWWDACPDANIGLPCGANGLAVIDLDVDHGSLATLERLERTFGPMPGTITQCTPTGGGHLVYRHPGGRIKSVANAFGDDMPGIDTRGDGGYIVAAPSLHPNGGRYAWLGDDFTSEPAPWPPYLTAIIDPPRILPRPVVPQRVHGGGYGAAALDGEVRRVLDARPGTRNHVLNLAAFNLGQLVAAGQLGREHVLDELLQAAQSIGLDDHEARATIASGMRGGTARPRGGAA